MPSPGDVVQKQAAVETHSAQADSFAARYDRSDDPHASCFLYSRHRLDEWMDRLLPSVTEGRRLVDVGCGTGHHMVALRERGFEVAGVDGSEAMLDHARAHNPGADIRQADVDALPFGDGVFDVVLSIEVLRYLPRPESALREMARVLRPGGAVIVTAAPRLNLNGYWLVNRLAARLKPRGLTSLRQFFTTARALRRMLAVAGFTDVEVHGVYLGPVNWIERLARPLLPATLRAWEPIDRRAADLPLLRELSNMYVVRARRAR